MLIIVLLYYLQQFSIGKNYSLIAQKHQATIV